jgi:hypothetical protein
MVMATKPSVSNLQLHQFFHVTAASNHLTLALSSKYHLILAFSSRRRNASIKLICKLLYKVAGNSDPFKNYWNCGKRVLSLRRVREVRG